MSFAIEDARDTLERDIGGAAALIQTRASSLLSAVTAQGEPRAAFFDMADAFHTVYGTTMLVGAASIGDTAAVLETLCRQGQAALAELEVQRESARRIAALCVETADHITQVLALELAGRRPEAVERGSSFRAQRVKEVEAELATRPQAEAPGEAEFAFDDALSDGPGVSHELASATRERPANDADTNAAEGAGRSKSLIPSIQAPHLEFVFRDDGDEIQRELLPIFHHEAKEGLSGISAQLAVLAKDARSLASVAQLERAFHKLKGAASVLGLAKVAELCKSMQDRLQGILDAESSVSPEVIADIVAGTNQILTAAGLPDLQFVGPDQGLESRELDATQLFRSEAKQACDRALAIAAEMPNAPVERHRELSIELGKLFHHLKGSALISASPIVAEEAGRLSTLAESGAGSAPALVTKGVEKMAAALGLELAPTAPVTSDLERPRRAVEPALRRESVTLIQDATLQETILQDCADLFDAINKSALALDTSDRPRVVLAELFRQYHTLKGVVNTAGITPTGQVLHRVEDFLEMLEARAVLPSPRAIASFLLRVQADVQRQVEQSRLGYVEYSLEQIDAAIARISVSGESGTESIASQWGRSSIDRQAASQSVDSGSVEPREAGERRHIRVETRRLDTLMNLAGELVVSRSRLTTRALLLKRLQQELKRSNRRLVDSVDRFRDDHEFTRIGVRAGSARADMSKDVLPDRMQARPFLAQFGELELDRYDDVNVLARRLAEVTSDVSELNAEIVKEISAIVEDSDAFGTFVSGIQTEVTRARMIELDAIFARVRLQVRDAAERESKDVRVAGHGENVSIDKSIADALFAPLMHLVRNAVVHGIEAPEQRARLGKTPHGNVELTAREEGGQVVIQVSDDGAGLDLAALRERGARLGLIDGSTPLGDPRVKDLVFAPGLSTKAVAGAVSGRGVGGDVVRRTVERMNGSAHVASTPGRGTTFTLVLPVTLSIARALLVQQQERRFAVPLHFCERIVDAVDAVLVESAGVRRLRLEDHHFPVRRLDEVLGKASAGDAGPVLVLRVGQQRLCLQVERVLGHEEIVVKGVGDLLANHPLLAGATICGDGELALILDVPSIIEADVGGASVTAHTDVSASPPDTKRLAAPAPLGPARDERGTQSGEQQRGIETSMLAATKKLRVLFADDSLSVRRVAEKTLLGLGVDVTLAVDGVDAVEKLRGGGFDILFTDLEMPRMHGYDLIREVRMLPAYRTLPIVVISSRSGTKHREQAMQLGASEYMTKPFSAKGLDAAIERLCRNRAQARSIEAREVT